MVALDTTSGVVAILSWISKDLSFVGKGTVTRGCVAKDLNNPGFMQGI